MSARKVLLDASSNDVAYKSFSSFTMVLCVAFVLSAALGVLVSLAYTLIGLFHLYSDMDTTKARRIFITFIPNKAVLCIFPFFTALTSLFPHALVKLIDRTLMIYTRVHYLAGDLIIYCAILALIPIIYFAETKKYYTDEVNIFSNRKIRADEYNAEDTQDSNEDEPDTSDENDDVLIRMRRLAKDEQAENLRKLLNKKDPKYNLLNLLI
jgi:hypothetical protein